MDLSLIGKARASVAVEESTKRLVKNLTRFITRYLGWLMLMSVHEILFEILRIVFLLWNSVTPVNSV